MDLDTTNQVRVSWTPISRIVSLRNTLVQTKLFSFLGETATGEVFEDLVTVFHRELKNVPRSVVYQSLLDLPGKLLTYELLRDTAWRLAGNITTLRKGQPAPLCSAPPAAGWAPLHVLRCKQHTNDRGKLGAIFWLRVLAGPLCPQIVRDFWSQSFVILVARRIGFTRAKGLHPFHHVCELVNLRLAAKLAPGGRLFVEVGGASPLRAWNRKILQMRARKGWTCPYEFEHECWQCPMGLKECPAAVHYANQLTVEETQDGKLNQTADF